MLCDSLSFSKLWLNISAYWLDWAGGKGAIIVGRVYDGFN
ncbi:MAG: hypothetical protein ACI9FD_001720 [Gammaproteobacteria bacterium]|jgi:hypothetical protein